LKEHKGWTELQIGSCLLSNRETLPELTMKQMSGEVSCAVGAAAQTEQLQNTMIVCD
jgi:hypothetical protein